MSGIGLVLNVAKDALLTQQYAIDVTAHNIANVNTEGYSRQIAVMGAKDATPYGGFLFGRGVELDDIISNTNSFIEKRLYNGQSDLMATMEKENYMAVMESIFNENSSRSLSSQFSDFWNAWQDLANNPTGNSERSLLVENGELLAQSFRDLSNDLERLNQEINNTIDAGLGEVNRISSRIADLNKQIIIIEASGNANDLRDQRTQLVGQLSNYIDLNTYKDSSGNLQVTTKKGYLLVNRADSYSLDLDGTEITWQSSGAGNVAITDTITGGKLGGWLDIRDEVVPEYSKELDELARATVWEVNRVHSQGIGLEGFTEVTGSYSVFDSDTAMGNSGSGLDFYDKITDGQLTVWLYDSTGEVAGDATISVSLSDSLNDLASAIDSISAGGVELNAHVINGKLQIETDSGAPGEFAFSNDTANILSALGINTFFNSSKAGNMELNSFVEDGHDFIAAAKVNVNGSFAAGDNSNALDISELQYNKTSIKQWVFKRGEEPVSRAEGETTIDSYLHTMVGSIGIESRSVLREREYKEVIQAQISTARDNLSAVSLDEEMANLIKFQHAYTAAAKLISTADKMLEQVLSTV